MIKRDEDCGVHVDSKQASTGSDDSYVLLSEKRGCAEGRSSKVGALSDRPREAVLARPDYTSCVLQNHDLSPEECTVQAT